MEELGVYVIRVYRRDALALDGVVESVKSGESLPFHSTEELWEALHDLPSGRRHFLNDKPDKGEGT